MIRLTHNVGEVRGAVAASIERRVARVENAWRAVIVSGLKDIQTRSPVDTGLFRASTILSAVDPDDARFRSVQETTTTARLGEGQEQLSLFDDNERIWVAWFSNNLPYARAIEHGHSRQKAPQGVFGIERQRMAEKFKKYVSRNNRKGKA